MSQPFSREAITSARQALRRPPSRATFEGYTPERRAAVVLILIFANRMVDEKGLLNTTMAGALRELKLAPSEPKEKAQAFVGGIGQVLKGRGLQDTKGGGMHAETTLRLPDELRELLAPEKQAEPQPPTPSPRSGASRKLTAVPDGPRGAPSPKPEGALSSEPPDPKDGADTPAETEAAVLAQIQLERRAADKRFRVLHQVVAELGVAEARQMATDLLRLT